MSALRRFATARHLALIALILGCALSRIIPHPWNFSPIEAVALFSGAYFASRSVAIAVPLLAMLLADSILGFHGGMPVIYACIAVMAIAGNTLGRKVTALRVAMFGLASAVFFYLVTNFMVWVGSGMYAYTLEGLLACYVAAIPFFHNQLAGVAVYATVLFGGWALLRQRVPRLADA